MNKVILMGRLTSDPEVRYSQTNICIARYTLAVNRRFKKDGEPDADFINCVAFGKSGEFVEKYLKKGQMIGIVGRIQTGVYEKDGRKYYRTDIIVEEHHFTGGKNENSKQTDTPEGFYPIDEGLADDSLPF